VVCVRCVADLGRSGGESGAGVKAGASSSSAPGAPLVKARSFPSGIRRMTNSRAVGIERISYCLGSSSSIAPDCHGFDTSCEHSTSVGSPMTFRPVFLDEMRVLQPRSSGSWSNGAVLALPPSCPRSVPRRPVHSLHRYSVALAAHRGRYVISPTVKVPVLSVQMTVVEPSVSTAAVFGPVRGGGTCVNTPSRAPP